MNKEVGFKKKKEKLCMLNGGSEFQMKGSSSESIEYKPKQVVFLFYFKVNMLSIRLISK